jgi:methylthioribose-1-phosphate isomerase
MTTPPDPSRRQFFRRFAGDVVTGAATVVNAVGELRDRSAAEASSLLSDGTPQTDASQDAATFGSGSVGAADAATAGDAAGAAFPRGFRTPFRFADDDTLLVVDQRRLPDVLLEVPVRTAAEAAAAIRDMVVRGAPAIGQVAAIGLALQARVHAPARPPIRRAILEGAANTLRSARPTAVNLRWAVDRVMARHRAFGPVSEDGPGLAVAMMDEALAIIAEATDDHGRLAEAGQALLPTPEGRPVRVLTHCNTGPLACGQFWTALGIVQVAHHAERPIHVWVDETRPYLQGARITAWELAQAGVPHTLLPDMAAGPLMASGQVDVVLVGADRIAANGDTANKLGTYTLAVLAARHGVPFAIVAPLSSVDLGTTDGAAIPIEERPADEVTTLRGVRIAPAGTAVRNPAFDVTPAELIGAIVTEEGVLRPPFGTSLSAAMERRDLRRAQSIGVGAGSSDPSPADPASADSIPAGTAA